MKNSVTSIRNAALKSSSDFDTFTLTIIDLNARLSDRLLDEKLLKELVMKYVQAERELIELNKLKNKFLGMAAHDLRNPLAAIRGFSELLLTEEDIDEESKKEFITNINETADELLTMLNDLLDVSIIESGKLEIMMNETCLGTLIKKRVTLIEVVASKKEIKIELKLEELPEVPLDKDRISQVLDNIISNSIKFSPQSSTIYISLGKTDNAVMVKVKDNGPGISDEDKEKLFGEFQKLSAVPTGGERSTGLGLSIAKKIVEAHKGTIGVTSKSGKGSEFYFSLPA